MKGITVYPKLEHAECGRCIMYILDYSIIPSNGGNKTI